jgi:4-diphosphocytidyl-2-C-methyl-D-erythritol kinase
VVRRLVSGLAISAWAKLNLHLQVIGRRPDGFHELRTVFQTVSLGDDLVATPASDGQLNLVVEPGGSVDSGPGNLVLRAARRLWDDVGSRPGASLILTKRIPVGGGLGGGSSDAAAALVLLSELWGLDRTPADLFRLGAELGSDVPFFLVGGTALGVGRGEEVWSIPDPGIEAIVVCAPDTSVSTPEVFAGLGDRSHWTPPDPDVWAWASGHGERPPWPRLRNDLAPAVVDGWPDVGAALDAVAACPGCRHAAVTGSGAAVFGIFPDFASAEAAVTLVADTSRRAWAVRPLNRRHAAPAVRRI